jgi:hypothetical protein
VNTARAAARHAIPLMMYSPLLETTSAVSAKNANKFIIISSFKIL